MKIHYVMKINCICNLPYNISTEIICKWILNIDDKNFGLKFDPNVSKEVADRII